MNKTMPQKKELPFNGNFYKEGTWIIMKIG